MSFCEQPPTRGHRRPQTPMAPPSVPLVESASRMDTRTHAAPKRARARAYHILRAMKPHVDRALLVAVVTVYLLYFHVCLIRYGEGGRDEGVL